MRILLALALVIVGLAAAAPAWAREQINLFDVVVDVEADGDIVVTETIEVVSEGVEVRRGIFRDLPRYYNDGEGRIPYSYDVLLVMRDGREEPYETSTEGNAFRIRIGDPNTFLEYGPHNYQVRYRVQNQVRFFETYDEVYWNATGNYWSFPIVRAQASVVLPEGAAVTNTHGYTGRIGESGEDVTYGADGRRHVFETTRELAPGEGLTIAVEFEKGLIAGPSVVDQGWKLWRRWGALGVLALTLCGLFWFLYRGFEQVGRDPPKGPVFPRYEAPASYSPAATHYIYHRGVSGHDALIATLMQLAVKGRLEIDASDKKQTILTLKPNAPVSPQLTAEDLELERAVFGAESVKRIGEKYDAAFTRAYQRFSASLSSKYGSPYFKWNAGYTALSVVLTIIAIVLAIKFSLLWTIWHTAGVLALAALNLVFMYLMPAPTPVGQRVRTEIQGFRLYMETAEKQQLNAVEVGSEAPPPMTTERYEKFLPYAVALGVEKPWTQHFERLLPEEARNYHPGWSRMGGRSYNSLSSMNSAMVAAMSSGVVSALPQSSSSSGSGGGGSSGGGGGGGGGGGW